jgi:hypothetical protein
MAIPRKTLLVEELAGIYFRTLEARNSGDVRGKFEASTCALTKSQHGVETLYHCGKLVWRSKGMLAALMPSTITRTPLVTRRLFFEPQLLPL